VGLKHDLRDDPEIIAELAKVGRKPITYDEGVEKMSKIGAAKYFECSAKANIGVNEIFFAAAKLAMKPRKRSKECIVL
jgi:GTPase SAR1 family protein